MSMVCIIQNGWHHHFKGQFGGVAVFTLSYTKTFTVVHILLGHWVKDASV